MVSYSISRQTIFENKQGFFTVAPFQSDIKKLGLISLKEIPGIETMLMQSYIWQFGSQYHVYKHLGVSYKTFSGIPYFWKKSFNPYVSLKNPLRKCCVATQKFSVLFWCRLVLTSFLFKHVLNHLQRHMRSANKTHTHLRNQHSFVLISLLSTLPMQRLEKNVARLYYSHNFSMYSLARPSCTAVNN